MGEGERVQARVVVVSHDQSSTVTDCLDGVADQVTEGIDVIVVDLDSSDGSADAAIRHPLPSRVVVAAPGDLDRVLDAATVDAPSSRIVLCPADRRPRPGWLQAVLDGLADDALLWGPDEHTHHLAIDRARLPHLSLVASDRCEVARRVQAAGATLRVVSRMATTPARPRPPDLARLPVTPRPGPDVERHPGLVSIVVCTRDRPDQLARCLSSLDGLVDDAHEVIVVDNNDEPSVPAGLRGAGRVVHEPGRGLDRARNRGLAEAAGDVVAYVDDDCEVDPHWLAGVRAGFAHPAVGVVTGRVRPASLARPSQRWFETHFGFDRGTRPQHFGRWDRRPWFPLWAGGIGTGCNMAFRRAALEELGGFDELLDMGTPIGGGGDLDAFSRFIDRDGVIAYRPDALVWHHHRATETEVTRQFVGYGASVGALVAKSVLERPGQRLLAIRFFLDRFRVAARLVRHSRAGSTVLPARLVLADLAGQCVGPFLYLAGRAGAGRSSR